MLRKFHIVQQKHLRLSYGMAFATSRNHYLLSSPSPAKRAIVATLDVSGSMYGCQGATPPGESGAIQPIFIFIIAEDFSQNICHVGKY